ncbi:MAG: RHS repeat-associated core domain-containing protein [Thermodesulfobacteriota bacterium]|nr:RHS repeat-associated core domain-containing protein [Thermodesulfobacteriota bacterium]
MTLFPTDPDDKQKTTKKDYLGRTMEVKEHDGAQQYVTTYVYNGAGDLLKVTDPANNETTMEYDTLGRKTSMDDPDMGSWAYTYDANGNLLTQTDEKNQTITLAYDALNRKTSKTYSTSDPTVTYTYDQVSIQNGLGRPYSVSNGNVTTTINEYDAMGRVKSVTKQITGASSYTTEYDYDYSAKPTTITYPGSYEVYYSYYPGTGLLSTVTDSDERELAEYTSYEPTGKMGQVDYGNNTTTVHTYDPYSTKLTGIVTSNGSGNLLERYFAYSQAGDIQEIDDQHNSITYTYTYDNLHRLLGETNTGFYDAVCYTYNAIGNITSRTVGTDTFAYSYDGPQAHAVSKVRVNDTTDYVYDYDDNGNMTDGWNFENLGSVAARDISYNADNKPLTVVMSGTTTQLVYDGKGTRAKKVVSGGSTTYYVGKHLEIKDTDTIKYVFAGNTRIAKITSSQVYYYHKDHLGSSAVMTDATGAQVEATEYMAFGGQRDHTGTEVTDYRYTGQELDTSTGLYNYRARLYDPLIGRFISPDTIVQGPSDPQTLNRYSYCRNNPLIYVDPTGHIWNVFNSRMASARSSGYGGGSIRSVFNSRMSGGRGSRNRISGVTAYKSRHAGCTPAAAAMVMDYNRKTSGLPNLMRADPQTAPVAAQFDAASREHIRQSWLPAKLDLSGAELGLWRSTKDTLRGYSATYEHPDNCIADFLGTSGGGTGQDQATEGLSAYIQSRGYTATVTRLEAGVDLTWPALFAAIDEGLPVLLDVVIERPMFKMAWNHSVVMVGYDVGAGTFQYIDPLYYPVTVVRSDDLLQDSGLIKGPFNAWIVKFE